MPKVVTDTALNRTQGVDANPTIPLVKVPRDVLIGKDAGVPLVVGDIYVNHQKTGVDTHTPSVTIGFASVLIKGKAVLLERTTLSCGEIALANPETQVFIGGV